MTSKKRTSPQRRALDTELRRCKKDDLLVRFVPDKQTRDYIGMNDKAAKTMGFPLKKKRTLMVDDNLSLSDKRLVVRHERIERGLMAKGKPYWSAPLEALRRE